MSASKYSTRLALGLFFIVVLAAIMATCGIIGFNGIIAGLSNTQPDAQAILKTATGLRMLFALCGAAGVVAGIILSVLILRGVLRDLNQTTVAIQVNMQDVAMSASGFSDTTSALAGHSSEQAAALEEMAAAMEQVSSMTRQTSDNADSACSLAEGTRSIADSCSGHMEEMSIAIGQVQEVSANTKSIVKGIDAIAFQTNLLALNAAVEAARAGDAGKGFAVVAQEVRHLAQRAAEAARSTSDLIDDSNHKIEQAMEKVFQVIDEFSKVADSTNKVSSLVTEISGASREQDRSIKEISVAVTQLDKLTQMNAEASDKSASSARQLNTQLDALYQVVDILAAAVGANNEEKAGTSRTQGSPRGLNAPRIHSAAQNALPARKDSSAVARITAAHNTHDDFLDF
jgi:methyl-accepting chemotaxis protein